MSPIPEGILDGIAARPDDLGAWEVLSDFLLENDAPGAALARYDLELLRGISNPDILIALADARAQRPKLPHEPWGGFSAQWRCGFLVRLTLVLHLRDQQLREVLAAGATQGLHTLVLEEDATRGELSVPLVGRLHAAAAAVTRHVRRLSIRLAPRATPLLAHHQREAVSSLLEVLPPRLERVDLALGRLDAVALPELITLAGRLPSLNLDGTQLPEDPELISALLATRATVFLGGTGLSPRSRPDAPWLAPDVTAWLEEEQTGCVTPLTPSTKACGFDAPSWPALASSLKHDLLGWSHRDLALEAATTLTFAGRRYVFHRR